MQKIRSRISKYWRKTEEPSKFVDEDVESLEYRNTADEILELHGLNFRKHAECLVRANQLTKALEKI